MGKRLHQGGNHQHHGAKEENDADIDQTNAFIKTGNSGALPGFTATNPPRRAFAKQFSLAQGNRRREWCAHAVLRKMPNQSSRPCPIQLTNESRP
jgi:hypothetical protein